MESNESKNNIQNSSQHAFAQIEIDSVYKAIENRRDMRHFIDKPINNDLLVRILNAAHHAPSVGLMQPWRFIRITSPTLRHKLHDLVEEERVKTAVTLGEKQESFMKLKVQGILECAEVVAVSLSDQRKHEYFGRRTLPEMDIASVGCAIQNLSLAARAEGIGVGWVSIFDPNEVAKLLQIPFTGDSSDQAKPIAILCIGHVKEFYDKPMLEVEKWRSPEPLNVVCYENYWHNQAISNQQKKIKTDKNSE